MTILNVEYDFTWDRYENDVLFDQRNYRVTLAPDRMAGRGEWQIWIIEAETMAPGQYTQCPPEIFERVRNYCTHEIQDELTDAWLAEMSEAA